MKNADFWAGREFLHANYEKPNDELYRVLSCNMPSEGSISSF